MNAEELNKIHEGLIPPKVLLYVKKLETIIDKQGELIDAPQKVVNLISENADLLMDNRVFFATIEELTKENAAQRDEIERLRDKNKTILGLLDELVDALEVGDSLLRAMPKARELLKASDE